MSGGGRNLDDSTAGGVTRRVFACCRRSVISLEGLCTEHSKNESRGDPGTNFDENNLGNRIANVTRAYIYKIMYIFYARDQTRSRKSFVIHNKSDY